MSYDNQDVYLRHDSDESGCDCGCGTSSCGCCPEGLVSVVDCGKDIGCLTPNDAALYKIESHIPEINYVKVYDPRTGEYLGDMLPADAITYLTYLETLPPVLNITLTTTSVLCNGDSTGTATYVVSGGTAPYVPTWSVGDPAAIAAGSHTLTIVDAAGISSMVSFVITEPPVLAATSSTTPDSGATDGTATVEPTGGVSPYTYLWDDLGAQITQIATGLAAGTYQCTITDFNGCVLVVSGIIVV